MRATYAPGSPLPPAHLHPAQTERFAVHEGNPGEVPAVATWQTRPALRSADFHCAIAAARESGDVGRLLGLVEEYSDVLVLAPQPVDP